MLQSSKLTTMPDGIITLVKSGPGSNDNEEDSSRDQKLQPHHWIQFSFISRTSYSQRCPFALQCLKYVIRKQLANKIRKQGKINNDSFFKISNLVVNIVYKFLTFQQNIQRNLINVVNKDKIFMTTSVRFLNNLKCIHH